MNFGGTETLPKSAEDQLPRMTNSWTRLANLKCQKHRPVLSRSSVPLLEMLQANESEITVHIWQWMFKLYFSLAKTFILSEMETGLANLVYRF